MVRQPLRGKSPGEQGLFQISAMQVERIHRVLVAAQILIEILVQADVIRINLIVDVRPLFIGLNDFLNLQNLIDCGRDIRKETDGMTGDQDIAEGNIAGFVIEYIDWHAEHG